MADIGTSRRELLKKGAVAGAVAWSVPTLTSSPAFAAGSLSTNLCPGDILLITYQWQYGSFGTWSVCNEPSVGNDQPLSPQAQISGTPPASPCYIAAYRDTNGGSAGFRPVSVAGGNSVTGWQPISFGQQFTILGPVSPNSEIWLSDLPIAPADYRVRYHFSCSQPLCFNDKHGAFRVVSYAVT